MTAKQQLEAAQTAAHIQRLLDVLHENLARANQMQYSFLEQQAQTLRTIAAGSGLTDILKNLHLPQVLISKDQLREFGTGLIAKCFGPAFALLDKRRTPRIPNGDLLMIERVTAINGQRGKLNAPADITSEVEVPPDAWYLSENSYPGLPMAILMEMALQPCGILSAYLGTSLSLPTEVNTFRNLDGTITFSAAPDLRNGTIRNHARLLSSVSSGGMLIQKFAFELSAGGSPFLKGESSFGYFKEAAMRNQNGLDNGARTAPDEGAADGQTVDLNAYLPTGRPHLDLIENVTLQPAGGPFGRGLISGSKRLRGKEWFYRNHFYQDPVMPGSLGVEAIMQALWAYLQQAGAARQFRRPRLDLAHKEALSWKYRGQVIPANEGIQFAAYIKEIDTSPQAYRLLADADFWVDGMRIYAIQNISMTITEGN
jgi:3-hydroxymyristoyl/3-hydroxydecanoyl-(acyl carrier protein) dehydratase